jgi:hypothetical protein
VAVISKESLLEKIRDMIGTENAESDEAISLLEDMSDTFDDLSSQVSQAGDYKKKYEENDAEWRKRYHDRFFSVTEDDIKEDDKDDEVEKKTFESLFKED